MTSDYLSALRFAALFHDIEKCDSDNHLNRNKREANQGCGSAALLIRCGLRDQKAGLKLIREHHLRKRGDPILRQADQISSRNRLEGGTDKHFLKHFPQISNHVKVGLTRLMNDFNDSKDGYNQDVARAWVAVNRWLDLIPADMSCSLESQSLREHLLETESYTKTIYADPSLGNWAIEGSIKLKHTMPKTNRVESWKLLGER